MTYFQREIENAAIGVAVAGKLEDLEVFLRPGVAASIWRRQLPNDFQDWINSLEVESLPSARILVRLECVRNAVEVICDKARLPNDFHRLFFVNDVVQLAEQFAAMMGTNSLGLRFDVIGDDACRKFHIDAVSARLVCTYRGAGTQYGISIDGNEPKRVFSVPTGAPLLLKGSKWPTLPASGLLHRSPPIEGTGMTRLVMVIDPVFHDADVLYS